MPPLYSSNGIPGASNFLYVSLDQPVTLLNDEPTDWTVLINLAANPVNIVQQTDGNSTLIRLALQDVIVAPITATVAYTRTASSIQNAAGQELVDFTAVNINIA